MPWPKSDATCYHAQLGLQDKGHISKSWFDLCYSTEYLGCLHRKGEKLKERIKSLKDFKKYKYFLGKSSPFMFLII